jgi:Hsp33 protein
MSGSTQPPVQANQIELESHYVRQRHCMAVFGTFTELYVDYYLHQMQLAEKPSHEHDVMLKDALASMALHLMSRPQNEQTAWTINFQDPVMNLFVTGDSQIGNVVGRVFTHDVKRNDKNLFFSQVTRPRSPIRQSAVEVHGTNILRVVEEYYRQSEQLPALLFELPEEEYAMLVAQPDHDAAWFEAQTAESMATLKLHEELGFLERRLYYFGCGCTLQQILRVLEPIARRDVNELFAGDDHLNVGCPRCGGQFQVSRGAVDDYLAEHPGD